MCKIMYTEFATVMICVTDAHVVSLADFRDGFGAFPLFNFERTKMKKSKLFRCRLNRIA